MWAKTFGIKQVTCRPGIFKVIQDRKVVGYEFSAYRYSGADRLTFPWSDQMTVYRKRAALSILNGDPEGFLIYGICEDGTNETLGSCDEYQDAKIFVALLQHLTSEECEIPLPF